MKHNEIEDMEYLIQDTDLANAFHVYGDIELGPNNLFYGINRTFNFLGLNNISVEYYTEHVAKRSDTWTLLAFKYFGDDRLWWLVCKLNGITNPVIQPQEGEKIKILKDVYVKQVLDQINAL